MSETRERVEYVVRCPDGAEWGKSRTTVAGALSGKRLADAEATHKHRIIARTTATTITEVDITDEPLPAPPRAAPETTEQG